MSSTTTVLYREFTLRNAGIWQALVALIKGNAKAMVEAGTPIKVIVTTAAAKRNGEQNRRYWGYVLKTIAEQAWANGHQFDADVWHEFCARKYGVLEEMTLPDGEIITRRKSTTDMTVGEFAEYMTKVEAYAAQELGVEFA
jgi:NinB protein